MVEIILFEPEIPQNTGNVARTCAVTGTKLLLVRPFGFCLTSRHLKRAGLDYWDEVDTQCLDQLDSYLLETTHPFYFFSSKAKKIYTEINYTLDAILVFGSETKGLPQRFVDKWEDRFLKIPMREGVRCLNLATSAGIALYEVLRQHRFMVD